MAKNLIQSSFGQQNRNFEVVFRNAQGNLEHWVRPNDNPPYQWNRGGTFGTPGTSYGNPALIQSSFGRNGNFEVVVNIGGGVLEHWESPIVAPWVKTNDFASNVFSSPSLIESSFGGNFEVVFRDTGGRWWHWYRNNADSAQPWVETETIA